MNEKHPENAAIEKIVETQEENEQDDENHPKAFCGWRNCVLG